MPRTRAVHLTSLRLTSLLATLGLAVFAAAPSARADEGQWTPDQLAELDQARLKEMGLELTPEQLWNVDGDEKNGGLMRAAVNLAGCSAAFISPDGLIATNHHCAYSAIQANSTVEHDYLKNGFLATSRDQELEAPGKTVRVLRKITVVTAEVQAAAEGAKTDADRARAVERKSKELVKACEEKHLDARCNVASFYNGSEYRLFEYLELTDIRLVYAPPASIGEYGGEIDNWMWPRHTGDFSLMRAYVRPNGKPGLYDEKNVPYQPAQYLRVSAEGVDPGDFVAILGYPGRTQRYMPAAEVQRQLEQVLPFYVDFYGEWIELLESLGAKDEAVEIKVAALKKGLANRHKNSRGMIDGLNQMSLVAERRQEDEALRAWASEKGREQYAGVIDELEKLSAEARLHHEHDLLLYSVSRGPASLAIAIDLVRKAKETTRPDLERPSSYMDRNLARLWKRQEGRLRDFDPGVDAEVLAMFMARAAALPKGARIKAFDKATKRIGRDSRANYLDAAKRMVAATELTDRAKLEPLWEGADLQTLRRSKDPVIQLALGLVTEMEAMEARDEAVSGARTRLYPRYFEMLEATREGPIYPDANSTLRFSYASVQGYDKWNGETQKPQTTMAEALAKHTGADPFDLPARVRDAAPAGAESYWADPEVGDLTPCFLSNGDTTGGNSGSPVINGKGELVGLNFDRVWENIAGDFGYNQGHSRNVSVDIRYLLWLLDDVEGAEPLLTELAVADKRDLPRRDLPASKGASLPDTTPPPVGEPKGCAVDRPGPVGAGLALGLMVLLVLRRRRD